MSFSTYSSDWFFFLQWIYRQYFTDLQSAHFTANKSVVCLHGCLINDLWFILEQMFFDRAVAKKLVTDRLAKEYPAVKPALTVAKK